MIRCPMNEYISENGITLNKTRSSCYNYMFFSSRCSCSYTKPMLNRLTIIHYLWLLLFPKSNDGTAMKNSTSVFQKLNKPFSQSERNVTFITWKHKRNEPIIIIILFEWPNGLVVRQMESTHKRVSEINYGRRKKKTVWKDAENRHSEPFETKSKEWRIIQYEQCDDTQVRLTELKSKTESQIINNFSNRRLTTSLKIICREHG